MELKPQCHPLETHYAKGKCKACWYRDQYQLTKPSAAVNRDIRPSCHPERIYYSKGYCYECWREIKPLTRIKRMAECHPERIHYGKGMCQQCYDANKQETIYPIRREAIVARSKAYYAANKPKVFARALKRMYGITIERYSEILAKQDGVCAICKFGIKDVKRGYFCVDHDHRCCPARKSCGKCIRGLLCITCNAGLGQFADSIEMLIKATDYLRSYQ